MRLFFTFLLAAAAAALSALAGRWLAPLVLPESAAAVAWWLVRYGPAALLALWLSAKLDSRMAVLRHGAAAGLGSALVYGVGLYLHLGTPPLSAAPLEDLRYAATMSLLFAARWIVGLAALVVARRWGTHRLAPA